jgi:hypothetical protein
MNTEELMIMGKGNGLTYCQEYGDRVVHSEIVVAPAEINSIIKTWLNVKLWVRDTQIGDSKNIHKMISQNRSPC